MVFTSKDSPSTSLSMIFKDPKERLPWKFSSIIVTKFELKMIWLADFCQFIFFSNLAIYIYIYIYIFFSNFFALHFSIVIIKTGWKQFFSKSLACKIWGKRKPKRSEKEDFIVLSKVLPLNFAWNDLKWTFLLYSTLFWNPSPKSSLLIIL